MTLTDDITDAAPGAAGILYISLGDTPGVDGLDASGTLQIGLEQITYSAKTTANDGVVITARGANSSTAAAHVAGEVIYQIEAGAGHRCAATRRRWSFIARVGKPALSAFKLYASRQIIAPGVPDDDAPTDANADLLWSQDYDLLATVTGNTNEVYTYTHSATPKRYRWFLLVCTAMTTAPYRFMVNEFKVEVAGTVYSSVNLPGNGTVYAAASAIMAGCGLPTAACVDGGSTPTVIDYTTAPDPARGVLSDLADMTKCLCNVGRDSKLTVGSHPYFGTAVVDDNSWSKTHASAYAPDWAWGRNVGQVQVAWQSLDNTTSGTVKYPVPPDPFGDVLRVGPLRVADAAAALAQAELRYWLFRCALWRHS